MRVVRRFCTAASCLALASMSLTAIGAATAVGPATATGAAARTHVVHPGQSIQAAVNRSHPGDTVVVAAGHYRQNVVIQKNGLTLRARGIVKLTPPATPHGVCNFGGEVIGICVVPRHLDISDFSYDHRVGNVTVRGFRVKRFSDGVLGFGTRNLTVTHVRAVDNEGYGIASFDGIGSTIRRSFTTGSDEAGIYVGDSPNARAVVAHNLTWRNGFGVFVRHTHDVTVRDNRVRRNCVGVFLLHDGQPEGSVNNRVADNRVRRNNRVCTEDEGGDVTTFGGSGILLLGSRRNHIVDNVVIGNHGRTAFSGGIVLRGKANGNWVLANDAHRNRPFDIRKDASSLRNHFAGNHCRTSKPARICAG